MNLKDMAKSDWWSATGWLLWTSVGGLFPVWAGFVAFHFMSQKPTLATFSNNGQFALYAASFITASSYIVFKEYKTESVFFRRAFGGACLICVIAICFIFIFTIAGRANVLTLEEGKLSLLRKASYLLYCVSALIAYALTILDKKRTGKDFYLAEQESLKKLEKEVRAIGE